MSPEAGVAQAMTVKHRRDWLVLAVALLHACLVLKGFWDVVPLIRAGGAQLRAAIIVILAFSGFAAAIAVGLWLGKRWARWAAIALNGLIFAALLSEPILERQRMAWDDIAYCALFGALFVTVLLPAFSRRLAGS